MWGNLLAPLRLPERVLEALDELAELRAIRLELTRVREQTEPLDELLPALERLNEDLATRLGALHETLAPVDERLVTIERTTGELVTEVKAIHESLRGVDENIQRMSGLRGERGLAERARDRVVGGKD